MQSGADELNLTNEYMTRLYDDNAEDLLRFFARRTVDSQVALDLVSETFAQAIASRNTFRGDSHEDGRRWLFGIARNLMNNYFRRGYVEQKAMQQLRFEPVDVGKDDAALIEELAQIEELRAAVERALDTLKPKYREAVQSRILEQKDYPEVAASLGISEDAARARVSRGLKKLKTELEQVRDLMEDSDA